MFTFVCYFIFMIHKFETFKGYKGKYKYFQKLNNEYDYDKVIRQGDEPLKFFPT